MQRRERISLRRVNTRNGPNTFSHAPLELPSSFSSLLEKTQRHRITRSFYIRRSNLHSARSGRRSEGALSLLKRSEGGLCEDSFDRGRDRVEKNKDLFSKRDFTSDGRHFSFGFTRCYSGPLFISSPRDHSTFIRSGLQRSVRRIQQGDRPKGPRTYWAIYLEIMAAQKLLQRHDPSIWFNIVVLTQNQKPQTSLPEETMDCFSFWRSLTNDPYWYGPSRGQLSISNGLQDTANPPLLFRLIGFRKRSRFGEIRANVCEESTGWPQWLMHSWRGFFK